MFRSMSGFKAQYDDLTLLVISEFNEWKVLIHGPGTTILGVHQFSEDKAKEHAAAVARAYIRDRKHAEPPEVGGLAWNPLAGDDWLVWSGSF